MGSAGLRKDRYGWVVALVLTVSMLSELPLGRDVPYLGAWWAVSGGILLGWPAILAPRWPIPAGLAAAVLLVGQSVVVCLADDRLFGRITLTESVAVLIIMVVVVRVTPGRTAAPLVAVLIAAHAVGDLLRGWWVTSLGELVWEALLPVVFVFGSAVAVGLYLRSLDLAVARATRAAVTAAQRRERADLARELHDVVAHHVGGIVVQAQAARVVAATAPGAGDRVLPLIESAGTDALSAMRRMVAVLRDGRAADDPPGRPTDLVADLHAVAGTVPGGTPVRLTVELAEQVPAEVAGSVLRLVQESVINARRHAVGAGEISVTVRNGDGTVQIDVRDDGRPGEPGRAGGGFGLVGMRERAQLLGGRFSAGHSPGGGWRVSAELPLTQLGS